jgi:hypothetical protein
MPQTGRLGVVRVESRDPVAPRTARPRCGFRPEPCTSRRSSEQSPGGERLPAGRNWDTVPVQAPTMRDAEEFWDELIAQIDAGDIIPVVGPELLAVMLVRASGRAASGQVRPDRRYRRRRCLFREPRCRRPPSAPRAEHCTRGGQRRRDERGAESRRKVSRLGRRDRESRASAPLVGCSRRLAGSRLCEGRAQPEPVGVAGNAGEVPYQPQCPQLPVPRD